MATNYTTTDNSSVNLVCKTMTPEEIAVYNQAPHNLMIKLIAPSAKCPIRGSAEAAGYDLFASDSVTINKQSCAKIPLGIAFRVPLGTYGRIAPRSGLGSKFIGVGAGVVDRDYRGEVKVILYNHSDNDYEVKTGDRVAQLILEKIAIAPIVVCDTLDDTTRGAGGFGSTGR